MVSELQLLQNGMAASKASMPLVYEKPSRVYRGVSELSDVLADAILTAQMAYIPLIEIRKY